MTYVVISIVAFGTYLTRFLPMRYKEIFRKLENSKFLEYSSTSIISALFVGSFMSTVNGVQDIAPALLALSTAYLTWRAFKNLGLSVIAGVLAHLLVGYLT